MAPEVFKRCYDEKCDIWAAGVVFYVMCVGGWPFHHPDGDKLVEIIKSCPDVFGPENAEKTVLFMGVSGDSKAIKGLIAELLHSDPAKRPSAGEVLDGNEW